MSKSRNWLGTLNNPDITDIELYLKRWYDTGAAYVNGQLEKGDEGTVHIQFFLNYKEPCRLASLKKHDTRAHFQEVKRDNGASDYCLKEETRVEGPWEFGLKPARKNVKGETKERNLKILELGPEKCVEEGLIHIKEYIKVKQCVDSYRLNTIQVQDATDVRGTWIWGPPGVGKSHKARADHPGAYLKAQNKWWDGYTGQKSVIIDDMDTDCLGHYLKIWADKYACSGEIKGGTLPLNYDTLIVTSNYSIEALFKEEMMAAAIRRRFNVIHMTDPFK